jgi:hypothetical protein
MHISSIMVGNLLGSCLGTKCTTKGDGYNSRALDCFHIKITGQEILYLFMVEKRFQLVKLLIQKDIVWQEVQN